MTMADNAHTVLTKNTSVSVWLLIPALAGFWWLSQQLGSINTRLALMESESAHRADSLDKRLGGLDQVMLKYGVEIEGLQRRMLTVEQVAQIRETPDRNK